MKKMMKPITKTKFRDYRLSMVLLTALVFTMLFTYTTMASDSAYYSDDNANAPKIMYIVLENDLISDIGVLDTGNLYYLHSAGKSEYLGEMDYYDQPNPYKISLYDSSENILYRQSGFTEKITLPYIEKTRTIEIFKQGDDESSFIITKQVDFCNHNQKCEPCKENNGLCENFETSLTCPDDCSTGISDSYCDIAEDSICDPDCNNQDKDCSACDDPDFENICYYDNAEYRCMYDYNGVYCKDNEECSTDDYITIADNACCIKGYCIADITKKEEAPTEEQKKLGEQLSMPIEKYESAQISNSTPSNLIKYGVWLLLFVLVAIMLGMARLAKRGDDKSSSKADDVQQRIEELHNAGFNYSKIKQHLVRRGHEEKEIDAKIEKHYSENYKK